MMNIATQSDLRWPMEPGSVAIVPAETDEVARARAGFGGVETPEI